MTDAPSPRCSSGLTELRHCCFCTSEMVQVVFGIGAVYHVECPSCLASGPHAKNEATAAEAWNRYPLNVAQRQPDLHAWRFIKSDGQWTQWIVLPDAESVMAFKDLMGHNLERGTHQLQSFFAAPSSVSSTSRGTEA